MAVITHFRVSHRRIIGVLPMPDGGSMAFQGVSMAQVLRLWKDARREYEIRNLRQD